MNSQPLSPQEIKRLQEELSMAKDLLAVSKNGVSRNSDLAARIERFLSYEDSRSND